MNSPVHVRLGFLDGAVEFLQLLARRGRAAVDRDLMRADAVRHFVRQDVGEERIEARDRLRGGRQHDSCDRHQGVT